MSKKTELQKWESIMGKLHHRLEKQKAEDAKRKASNKKGKDDERKEETAITRH